MFDMVVRNNPVRTEYVTKTIHEHRAPTDESVKLLKELEDAALDKFLGRVVVDNEIKAQIECMFNPLTCSKDFYIRLKVNGKELSEKLSIPEWKYEQNHINTLRFKAIQEKIAEMISINIVNSLEHSTIDKIIS